MNIYGVAAGVGAVAGIAGFSSYAIMRDQAKDRSRPIGIGKLDYEDLPKVKVDYPNGEYVTDLHMDGSTLVGKTPEGTDFTVPDWKYGDVDGVQLNHPYWSSGGPPQTNVSEAYMDVPDEERAQLDRTATTVLIATGVGAAALTLGGIALGIMRPAPSRIGGVMAAAGVSAALAGAVTVMATAFSETAAQFG